MKRLLDWTDSRTGWRKLSPHARSEHMPQSLAQLRQSSKPPVSSHRPLPQTEHTPQSVGQLEQTSGRRHVPSPHPVHPPQSAGQVKQLSPVIALHVPSPQRGHAPQSGVHVTQSSPPSGRQKPSPHVRTGARRRFFAERPRSTQSIADADDRVYVPVGCAHPWIRVYDA